MNLNQTQLGSFVHILLCWLPLMMFAVEWHAQGKRYQGDDSTTLSMRMHVEKVIMLEEVACMSEENDDEHDELFQWLNVMMYGMNGACSCVGLHQWQAERQIKSCC